MSNQVYAAPTDTPQPFISSLVGAAPGGGIVVSSLTIASTPSVTTNSSGYLVRDPDTGLVMTQDATSVPNTGFTLRNVGGAGFPVPTGADVLVDFDTATQTEDGVSYAAGVFSLLYSGVYTASYSVCWDGLHQDHSAWITLLSRGDQRYANQWTVTYDTIIGTQTGSFSFIAEAGDEVRVFVRHDTGPDNHLLGEDDTPTVSSMAITRISPFVPPV
jgi:hypothetical protein